MVLNRRLNCQHNNQRQLGASLVEYGLLVAMISVMALVGVRQTGTSITCVFTKVSGHFQGLDEQAIVCASVGGQSSSNPSGYGNGGGRVANDGDPLNAAPIPGSPALTM